MLSSLNIRIKYVSKFNNPRQVQFFRLSDCETVKTPGCQPQQIGDESLARAGCKYYDSARVTDIAVQWLIRPTYQGIV